MNTDTLPASVLIRHQRKTYGPRLIMYYGDAATITAEVRYDDTYPNGHNSFAITATIKAQDRRRYRHDDGFMASGCCHEEVAKHFPELAPFIKWHLCSSDGPLHYVANTVYHAKGGELGFARDSAIWPDATEAQLMDKAALMARLPALMVDFKAAVESLGFVY